MNEKYEGVMMMEIIELLRDELHRAIDGGDEKKILSISKKLDKEILRFITIDKIISDVQEEKAVVE